MRTGGSKTKAAVMIMSEADEECGGLPTTSSTTLIRDDKQPNLVR